MLAWKCTAADTFTMSLMTEGASLLEGRGIQDQLYATKASLLPVDTMEDNETSVSVVQWTRQKLKLFQLPLLFQLEDQFCKFLASTGKQTHTFNMSLQISCRSFITALVQYVI